VGVGQLDSGLNRDVGKGVGQQRPHPLRADKFLPRCRDVAPVQRGPGSHRADQRRGEAFLHSGSTQRLAGLPGEGLGPVPMAACIATSARSHRAIARTSRMPPFSPMLTASSK